MLDRTIHDELCDLLDMDAGEDAINASLARCPDGECCECGEIMCPFGDILHFHHDGCPSCAEALGEETQN